MMTGQTEQALDAVEKAIIGIEQIHEDPSLAAVHDTVAVRLRDMGAISSSAVTTTIEQCALRAEAAGQAAVKRAAELNEEAMAFAAALRKHGTMMASRIDAFAKLTSEVASELGVTRSKLDGMDVE